MASGIGGADSDANADLVMSTSMSGNLSFELVLSPPRSTASPRTSKVLQSPTGASSPVSLETITSKLKTAEEKRGRRLDEKLEKIKEHDKHVSDVQKSRAEMMQALETGEDSVRKLMMMEELRQQHLEDLVQKLKDREKHMEQVHKRIAEQVRAHNQPDSEELERQLGDASLHRDMVLQAIREKQQEGNGQAKAKENITP